jgi:D-alanyl-D-alanine carboxypeptidase
MTSDKSTIIIFALVFATLISCKRISVNEPVSSNCQLPFADSSSSNSKNAIYQALLDKYVKKGLPGLIVLIKTPDKGLWIGASGYARAEDKTPMRKCNIVYSASIGKTFCAAAILKLAEEGKLNINDKINKYLPATICDKIPNGNSATIKNLLGHKAGIPNFEDNPQFIADFLNNPFAITADDLLKYEYEKKALFQPGEGYEYSSTGYELMTRIIDKVTAENHSKYYTSHIFNLLGLRNTYYKNEADFPKPAGLVNSYFDRLGDERIENISDANNYMTKIFTGSDGIMASIYDYYLFMEGLTKGGLVNSQSYNEMCEWKNTAANSTNKYGLGLQKIATPYGDKIGHRGRAVGAGIDMFFFPEKNTTIVSATNLGTFLNTKLTKKYSTEFQDELLDIVFK